MQKLNNENDHILEQELIRKYLADSLTKEEEALLAEKYQSDEDFRDALDGLEHLSVEEYEQQMSAIDQAIDKRLVKSEDEIIEPPKIIIEQGQVKPLINTKKFAIAASVILLLSSGVSGVLRSEC